MSKQKMFNETVIKRAIEYKTADRTWYDVSRMLRNLGHTRPDGRMLNPDSLCASVNEYRNRSSLPKVTQKSTPVKTQTKPTGTLPDLSLARLALSSNKLTDAQKVQIARQALT